MIETSWPPQFPPPAYFPILPISYPWGSFDACLCTQADETQATSNLPHLKKVPWERYGVLYYTDYWLRQERISSGFTDCSSCFSARIEGPPTRHSVMSVIFATTGSYPGQFAIRVTRGGLKPSANFPDKLDRWRHIRNRRGRLGMNEAVATEFPSFQIARQVSQFLPKLSDRTRPENFKGIVQRYRE